ncbi:unnamed protein product [Amoebophrya sp. A120]|nr:unnamed protein product [Amoebophrya sp. A120]|eukprot:GSA120T00001255001.1
MLAGRKSQVLRYEDIFSPRTKTTANVNVAVHSENTEWLQVVRSRHCPPMYDLGFLFLNRDSEEQRRTNEDEAPIAVRSISLSTGFLCYTTKTVIKHFYWPTGL